MVSLLRYFPHTGFMSFSFMFSKYTWFLVIWHLNSPSLHLWFHFGRKLHRQMDGHPKCDNKSLLVYYVFFQTPNYIQCVYVQALALLSSRCCTNTPFTSVIHLGSWKYRICRTTAWIVAWITIQQSLCLSRIYQKHGNNF